MAGVRKCLDCSTKLKSFYSIRCNSCAQKERFNHTDVWNKNTIGIMRANKTSFIKNDPRIVGENAYQWKGQKVGYVGLHRWVYKQLGKAKICTWCRSTENIQWANISGKYERKINDWMQLCAKCHHKYDDISTKGWITRRLNNVS